jgi:hypothetical protein
MSRIVSSVWNVTLYGMTGNAQNCESYTILSIDRLYMYVASAWEQGADEITLA